MIQLKTKNERELIRTNVLNYIGNNEVFLYDLYSENYLVSNYGRIFSIKTNKFLKLTINNTGYVSLKIYDNNTKKTILLHRIIARTFLNELHYEVNHIDANKLNNNLNNLELVTRSENLQHARDKGLFKKLKGSDNPSFIFTNEIIDDMINMQNNGCKLKEISLRYNTSMSYTCTLIKQRKNGKR